MFLPLFCGLLAVAVFVSTLVWTQPGPSQGRRLSIVAGSALALLFVTVAMMIAGGLLERERETAASQENQFGTGWGVVSLVTGLPLMMLALALLGTALLPRAPMALRTIVSIAVGILAGGLLWILIAIAVYN